MVNFRSKISKTKQKSSLLCLSTDKGLSGDKGKTLKRGSFLSRIFMRTADKTL